MAVTKANNNSRGKGVRSTEQGANQCTNAQQRNDETFADPREFTGGCIPRSGAMSEAKFKITHQEYI
jgi:hypothetical protein